MINLRNGYFDSGEYYCGNCEQPHHFGSEIGKEHIKYGSPTAKKKMLLERGVC